MVEAAEGEKAAEPARGSAAPDEAEVPKRSEVPIGPPGAARQVLRLSICNWNGR